MGAMPRILGNEPRQQISATALPRIADIRPLRGAEESKHTAAVPQKARPALIVKRAAVSLNSIVNFVDASNSFGIRKSIVFPHEGQLS